MKIAVDNTVPNSPDDSLIIELIAHARSRRAGPADGHVLLGAACKALAEHYGAPGAVHLIQSSLDYLCRHVLLGRPLDEGGGDGTRK